MNHGARAARQAERGFTLVEMLVVMAILALVLAVVPPLFSTSLSSATLKAASRDLASGLRSARSEAITLNKEVRFRLDLAAHSFSIGDAKAAVSLPSDVDIVIFTALSETESETQGDRAGAIRFFADGSSTGGGITLSAEDRKYVVLVDWLTGRVSIVD